MIIFSISIIGGVLVAFAMRSMATYTEAISGYIYTTTVIATGFIFAILYMCNKLLLVSNVPKKLHFAQDISNSNLQITDKTKSIINILENLGFSMLGIIGFPNLPNSCYIHVLIDKQGYTQAHISNEGTVVLISLFTDSHIIRTPIQYKSSPDPDKTSFIHKVYMLHQKNADLDTDKRGDLQLIDTLQSYLDWEREFGAQYLIGKLRNKIWGWGSIAVLLASLLANLAINMTNEMINLPQFILQMSTLLPVVAVILVFITMGRTGFLVNNPIQSAIIVDSERKSQ